LRDSIFGKIEKSKDKVSEGDNMDCRDKKMGR
jgi:hypothetical protein